MGGRMSRMKGKTFERLIARKLREIYPDVKRTLMAQARDGTEAADLEGTPWSVECKHERKCTIQAAFRQSTEASKKNGKTPIVVSRDNNGPILVTLSFEAFLDMVTEGMDSREQANTLKDTRSREVTQKVEVHSLSY